ncbi:MAG: DUF2974 domain-containing protein [Ruminococcus sp.]|nr:DUF2974 domain-containing protein [Ruminococcus sp.]
MSDMFDYLKWRGDITFSQLPINPVDTLIFSTLSYINFNGIVPDNPIDSVTLGYAAKAFFDQPDFSDKVHVKEDADLLHAAANTARFVDVRMCFYRSIFAEERETQFAAVSFILDNRSAVLAFRGTDNSLTGWKENFNMSFCESIPAQREALRYLDDFAEKNSRPLNLVGHSKGGNLAVYAAAKCREAIRSNIYSVYNHDGPGFTQNMMQNKGYLSILDKIHTYIPQSSIVGSLFEREDKHTVIKSRKIGIFQHDPYSWELLGGDFIYTDETSHGSQLADRAIREWLSNMNMEERSDFVEAIYNLAKSGDADKVSDIICLKNIPNLMGKFIKDEKNRHIICERLESFARSMGKIRHEEQLLD